MAIASVGHRKNFAIDVLVVLAFLGFPLHEIVQAGFELLLQGAHDFSRFLGQMSIDEGCCSASLSAALAATRPCANAVGTLGCGVSVTSPAA